MGALSMTNEQLAIEIKQGKTEYTGELWQNTYKLLYRLVTEYYNKLGEKVFKGCGATLDDLKQESYIAFVRMIKAYDPEKDFKFTSYANYQIKLIVFNILGIRTDKKRPLNVSSSLNEPVLGFDDEEKTIIDTLEDTAAVESFENAEDVILNTELKEAINRVMDEDLTELQRNVIIGRFYDNKTLEELGRENGISGAKIRGAEGNALRIMRISHKLDRFKDEYITDHSYYFTSLGSFRERMGSSQELVVERMEEKFKRRNELL